MSNVVRAPAKMTRSPRACVRSDRAGIRRRSRRDLLLEVGERIAKARLRLTVDQAAPTAGEA
jgi:hypothetical protein